jgi:hypothetical protein
MTKNVSRINGISRPIITRIAKCIIGENYVYKTDFDKNSHSWLVMVSENADRNKIDLFLRNFKEASVRAVSCNYLHAGISKK